MRIGAAPQLSLHERSAHKCAQHRGEDAQAPEGTELRDWSEERVVEIG